MKITGYPFILMRTPVQSISKAYDKVQISERMFNMGVYLSSVDFWKECMKGGELSLRDANKMDRSLAKYWIRSCARPTPYGTFAGSMLTAVEDGETQVTLNQAEHHQMKVRLDMDYIYRLVVFLSFEDAYFKQLKFYPNNSLYELEEEYRYAEFNLNMMHRVYELTAVAKTSYLQMILTKATEGRNIEELAGILVEEEGVEYDEAYEFLRKICFSQILVSELEPNVTGIDPLENLILKLSAIKEAESVVEKLKTIQCRLQAAYFSVEDIREIEKLIADGFPGVAAPRNALQVDVFHNTVSASIDKKIIEKNLRQLERLTVISRDVSLVQLQTFKEKFLARFEGKEVPLSFALDENLGIGYANVMDGNDGENALLDAIGKAQQGQPQGMAYLDVIQKFVLDKYMDHLTGHSDHIEITDEDLDKLQSANKSRGKFANSASVLGNFLKQNGKFDEDNFAFHIIYLNGPSAGNLVGRFTYGNDRLCDLAKTVLAEEEALNPDVIYAEVVHLPQSRVGNILLRPVLRKYEIPYVGMSGIQDANQIPLSDIMVSVQHGDILLYSRKFNKRIIPRLSTAHNFSARSLPVYQFLCDLQLQNIRSFSGWEWGMLNEKKRLPRVMYKNIILQKARWMVYESDFQNMPKELAAQVSFLVERFRSMGIPLKIEHGDADNIIYLNIEEEMGASLFLDLLKKRKKLDVLEFLMTEENCIVKDVNGASFTNEVIIPVKLTSTPDPVPFRPLINASEVQRSFLPGSEWLYLKIFSGSKTAEGLIKNELLSFVEEGLKNKAFERYFFIRYWEDGSHIRIRFYNRDLSKQAELQRSLIEVLQPLITSGTIHKVQVDTYVRELERYDPSLMDATETLFFYDSLAISRFLQLLEGEEMERYRLLFALRGIDALLDAFKVPDQQKQVLMQSMQKNFFNEFRGGLDLQRMLNSEYREYQKMIRSHLNSSLDAENEIEEAAAIFEERSQNIVPCVNFIMNVLHQKGVPQKIFELLPHYIHMFMNRMFISSQRKHELIVYHFLEKYYSSKNAQSAAKPVNQLT